MMQSPVVAPLRLAVAGLGRMGRIHALHAHELSGETGLCQLVALSTLDRGQAEAFFSQTNTNIPVFSSIQDLANARVCDAVVIATDTSLHEEHATLMLEAGAKVFLEKPLSGTLNGARSFSEYLQANHPDEIMLGFQRRFDEPLHLAKKMLDDGTIGRLFRIYSALEDSAPAPNGYNSTGILPDMAIHNVDEVLWLTGDLPLSGFVLGSNLHAHRLSTCIEDFDDAMLILNFGSDGGSGRLAEIQVSRNHVSGYRGETVLYGEKGQIRVGRFHANPREVIVEAYGPRGHAEPLVSRTFLTRDYQEALPEFIDRFGAAYKEELRIFLHCCLARQRFPVTHLDALRAQEIIAAAMTRVLTTNDMAPIAYSKESLFNSRQFS
jgi:myo-inositol 2-dehydrogenase / D-chiro-inositol 1-dehydrogenase